jgi:hypothetical protein
MKPYYLIIQRLWGRFHVEVYLAEPEKRVPMTAVATHVTPTRRTKTKLTRRDLPRRLNGKNRYPKYSRKKVYPKIRPNIGYSSHYAQFARTVRAVRGMRDTALTISAGCSKDSLNNRYQASQTG